MVIRCERCSTMYELDESLLANDGSPVQCMKCQHVFTAFPPPAGRAADLSLSGPPADAPRDPASQPVEDGAPEAAAPPEPAGGARPPAGVRPGPASPGASAAAQRGGAPHRAPRNGTPAVYRPAVPAHPARNVGFGRDSVSAVEARLRSTARLKWLAPAAVLAVVAVGAGAWVLLSGRGDPDAHRARAEAFALISLDDGASLERAAVRLTEAARRSPSLLGAAAADRALALVLRASSLAPDGEPAVQAGPTAHGVEVPEEARAREEQAKALARSAFEAIRAAQADAGDTPEVARALAIHHAARGETERAAAVLRAARQRSIADPWLELAEAWLDARDPDRAARERAAGKLAALAGSRPELLRGRYLLARTQASLGRSLEAVATLDALLAANPRHEAARALRDGLAAAASEARPQAAPAAHAQRAGDARAGERMGADTQPERAAAHEEAMASRAGQVGPIRAQAQPPVPQDPGAAAPVKVATQPRKRIAQPEEGAGASPLPAPLEATSTVQAPRHPQPAGPAPLASPHEPTHEAPQRAPATQSEPPAPPAAPPAPPSPRHRSAPEEDPMRVFEAGSGG